MKHSPGRIHLVLLVLLAGVVAGVVMLRQGGGPGAGTEPAKKRNPSTARLVDSHDHRHIYLLIGGSNMAGTAPIPEPWSDPIDRCELLDADKAWEPARAPFNRHSSIDPSARSRGLGPGPSFARSLLDQQPGLELGLVVNAGADTPIDEWLGKSKLYWGARGRTRAASRDGVLKGVLWLAGQADRRNPEGYARKLTTLIANLRADFSDPDLPVVIGGAPAAPLLQSELEAVVATTHFTALVGMDVLSTTDGIHLDTASQLELGERFATAMKALREKLPPPPLPPDDLQFIDPHVHAMSVTPLGLRAVAQWMDDRGVERCIVSPLNHKGSRPDNDEEYRIMLENFRPYRGRIDRMCIIDAGEVATVDEAVGILEREMADGAIGFGEHYGRDLMFDDPKNLLLYEACETVGLPVMFHIDQNKNMVDPGMPQVDRVLRKFPDCKLVAHAYWWRQFHNGACDRQLAEHGNLYADMSGKVVVNILNRDRKLAREFLIRHQDKILWATDEGWWSFQSRDRQMNQHYTFLEQLDLPDEVRRKIYRENARKVYALE